MHEELEIYGNTSLSVKFIIYITDLNISSAAEDQIITKGESCHIGWSSYTHYSQLWSMIKNDLMIAILLGLPINTKMQSGPLGLKPCNNGNTPDKYK